MNQTPNQPQPSKEEIAEMQKKMDTFYETNTPFLEKQCKYEELKARIECARYSFNEAIMKQAHLHESMQARIPLEKPSQEPLIPTK